MKSFENASNGAMSVFIGAAADLIHERELHDLYRTKVGGSPVTPLSCGEDVFNDVRCGICSSQLALVFQTHAPLNEKQIGKAVTQRWMYVFGCVQKGCGKDVKCWKVFRLQLPSETSMMDQAYVHDAAALKSNNPMETTVQCTNEGEGHDQECFSLEGLKTALERSSKRKNKKALQKKPIHGRMVEDGIKHHWDIQLPELHIQTQAEPPRHDPPYHHNEDDPIQTSIASYTSQVPTMDDDDDWQGEEYEVAYASPSDRAFQKFHKAISSFPKQCTRYSFNGVYLNPASEVMKPPDCSCCGSQRVFEFQLMPYLITAIYESSQCLQSDVTPLNRHQYQNAMQCFIEWDWMTVVVFSCRESCQNSDLQEYLRLVDN